jgi:hypothetical protein
MRLARGGSRLAIAVVATAAMAVLAGCGSDDEAAPAACLAPADSYLRALEAAPQPVRLEGSTPISDCLVPDQDPAELGRVGEELINAATRLNAAARADPSGAATVRLGYLVGAAQQGASESPDVHTELLRRLDAAARFNRAGKPLPASFERAFGKGYAAGQESG